MAADGGGRVAKELLDCQRDTSSGITVVSVSGNKHMLGTIEGPDGTPYDGGILKVTDPDALNPQTLQSKQSNLKEEN